jgi:hypothetical protein
MALVRLFRGLLKGVFLLAAGVAILVFALDLYLGLPGNVGMLRDFVSREAGVRVDFAAASVNLFKGAEAESLRVADPLDRQGPPLLTAPKAEATYAPLALLLQDRFLIRHLTLSQPVLAFSLNRPPALPPVFGPGGRGRAPLDLKSFNIVDGTLRILARRDDPQPVLLLSGLAHGGRLERNNSTIRASGQFTAQALAVGGLSLSSVEGAYDFADGIFKVPKLNGAGYHGQWTGSLKIDVRDPALPCEFEFQATSVDLNEFLKAVAGRPDLVSGMVALNLAGRGSLGSLDGVVAQGSFDLREGQIIASAFLQDLARAVSLPELAQPDIREGHGDLSIGNGGLTLANFVLKTAAFDLTGGGTIRFDGTAVLPLRIVFHPDLVGRLPETATRQMAAGADGSRTAAFTLTGPIDHLQSDLLKQLSVVNLQGAAR